MKQESEDSLTKRVKRVNWVGREKFVLEMNTRVKLIVFNT